MEVRSCKFPVRGNIESLGAWQHESYMLGAFTSCLTHWLMAPALLKRMTTPPDRVKVKVKLGARLLTQRIHVPV